MLLPQRFVVHSLEFVFVRRNDYCAASYIDVNQIPWICWDVVAWGYMPALGQGDQASSMIKPIGWIQYRY